MTNIFKDLFNQINYIDFDNPLLLLNSSEPSSLSTCKYYEKLVLDVLKQQLSQPGKNIIFPRKALS